MVDQADSAVDIERPVWQKDEECPACVKCNAAFTTFFRRHHCRACGKVVCSKCSNRKKELPPAFEYKGPERVCDDCYFYLSELESQKPGVVTDRPDYAEVEDALHIKLTKVLEAPEDTWRVTNQQKGVQLAVQMLKESAVFCVRSIITVAAPMTTVCKVYLEKELWKNWQPELLACRTIEKLDEEREIMYLAYNIAIVKNRDACVLSRARPGTLLDPLRDDAFSLFSCSTHHPACPLDNTYVRCNINFSLTEFTRIDVDGANGTKIQNIMHMDPRGMVPAKAINFMLKRAVDSVANMAAYMEKAK